MLTSSMGSTIKRSYEHDKEIEICDMFSLTRVTVGKGRKADAIDDKGNGVSIKNAKTSSTQVHLTTLSKFRELFDAPQGALDLFLGDKAKNRFNFDEIPSALVNELLEWMNANTYNIIHRIICGNDNIKMIIFRDLNVNKVYTKSTEDVLSLAKESVWSVGKRNGSLQLITKDGNVLFHLQREGKGKSPNNVLFHIHRKLFTTTSQRVATV